MVETGGSRYDARRRIDYACNAGWVFSLVGRSLAGARGFVGEVVEANAFHARSQSPTRQTLPIGQFN